jgi:hypothetical protein
VAVLAEKYLFWFRSATWLPLLAALFVFLPLLS